MPDDPEARPVAMVSSTAHDLPRHRDEVLEACLRQSTTPKMQEHLPASGAGAIGGSLERMSSGVVGKSAGVSS